MSLSRCREAPSQVDHPWAQVNSNDLVGPKSPQRERVPATSALQVDRPPARPVEVAEQRRFFGEQVAAAVPDELDRLGQPALVALGRLVPGCAGGRVHRPDVGRFGRGCGSNVFLTGRLGFHGPRVPRSFRKFVVIPPPGTVRATWRRRVGCQPSSRAALSAKSSEWPPPPTPNPRNLTIPCLGAEFRRSRAPGAERAQPTRAGTRRHCVVRPSRLPLVLRLACPVRPGSRPSREVSHSCQPSCGRPPS